MAEIQAWMCNYIQINLLVSLCIHVQYESNNVGAWCVLWKCIVILMPKAQTDTLVKNCQIRVNQVGNSILSWAALLSGLLCTVDVIFMNKNKSFLNHMWVVWCSLSADVPKLLSSSPWWLLLAWFMQFCSVWLNIDISTYGPTVVKR